METRQYKMTVGVVFLVSMIGAAAIHGSSEQSSGTQETVDQSIPVTVTAAESRNLEVWESSVGQLEAKTAAPNSPDDFADGYLARR
ncbi:TPA: hypothetical protein EYP38_05675 [Candidatus Micrarchaeota archaeon]|nr:hypothetical protein [Candidatus Micrarchaeota archaeon]